MGFNTEYLGQLTITPPLNPMEVQWLRGFADWGALGDGDAFSLPMNPRAELSAAFKRAGGALPSSRTIPHGVRDWVVCEHGGHLRWRRAEKSNDAVRAIGFLVGHYLGCQALAQQSGHPDFASFTFDHRLNGVIAGQRDDTDELFLLRVVDNDITWETLVPGRSSW